MAMRKYPVELRERAVRLYRETTPTPTISFPPRSHRYKISEKAREPHSDLSGTSNATTSSDS
jgi:hypothetical protein